MDSSTKKSSTGYGVRVAVVLLALLLVAGAASVVRSLQSLQFTTFSAILYRGYHYQPT